MTISRQESKRATAIDADFTQMETKAVKAVSDLTTVTSTIQLLVPFMHHNIINDLGDLTEGDRQDTRDVLVPLFPQLQAALVNLTEVFDIYSDDLAEWAEKLNAYYEAHPTLFDEAESRYPAVL